MDGTWAEIPFPVVVNCSSTIRWCMSLAWVVAPGAISTARFTALGVTTFRVPPLATLAVAEVIVGRAPLNRYGGE